MKKRYQIKQQRAVQEFRQFAREENPNLQMVIDHLPEEHKPVIKKKLKNAYAMTEYADAKPGLSRVQMVFSIRRRSGSLAS